MKFFQIHSFYDRYLDAFYAARPAFELESSSVQLSALLDDGFSCSHLFAPALGRLGLDSRLVIGNCAPLQRRWCAEAGFTPSVQANWVYEIPRQQIDSFKPEVLYISDPITYDSRFVRSLTHQPKLVIGWRAAEIPRWVDLTAFDIVLSHEDSCRAQAEQHGAKSTQYFLPGFPEWMAQRVANEPKLYDLVFCGQITRHHTRRRELLDQIASHAEATRAFTPHLFINTGPEAVCAATYAHPAVWGLKMHRAIKRGKVNLNVGIDLFQSGAGNMRQFEVTGTGSFLIAEKSSALERYFSPGYEVETYSSVDELVEKTEYYLENAQEREAIALRGQARCLREHGMGRRAREFLDVIESGLRWPPQRKAQRSALAIEVSASSSAQADPEQLICEAVQALKENRVDDGYRLVLEAQTHTEQHRWLLYLRAVCLLRLEKIPEALEDLQQEIALFPDNHQALELQQQVLLAICNGQPR